MMIALTTLRNHVTALIASTLSLGACGVAEGPVYWNYAAPPNTVARAKIGARGGAVQSEDGRVRVDVPPGALAESVDLTITRVETPIIGALGSVYDIGPTDTPLQMPVRVTLTYDPSLLAGTDTAPALATLVDEAWRPLELESLDGAVLEVTGVVVQLGTYAVVAVPRLHAPREDDAAESCCEHAGGRWMSGEPNSSGHGEEPTCALFDTSEPACPSKKDTAKFWSFWECRSEPAEHVAGGCSDCLADCCRSASGNEGCSPGVITLELTAPPVCQCSSAAWLSCAERCAADGRGAGTSDRSRGDDGAGGGSGD